MMKLIASDFDGTILIDESISKNDIKAIRDFQNAGNLFGLVTGRSYHNLSPLIEGKITPDYIIANNGGHILVRVNDTYKEIFKSVIKKPAAQKFIDLYAKDYEITIFTEDRKLYDLEDVDKDIMALAIYTEQVENHLENIFDFHYSIGVVDVVNRGIDKQKGIDIIKDYYKYQDEVYAIGDDYNDIVFLKATKRSYTLSYVTNPYVNEVCMYRVESIADLIKEVI
ncbi:HAD family hydrolase [Anaerococcus sp. NML200574]|uniref:HAD family hydrolase n=1 Tax=Anaerococcus sp. NML200574 TaxID=2954486 RepID=UPI0022383492|nr:HAD family hydrolase [Anaerococcus sp. NML200574]MCW6678615.1 HAD family hydrolase [Anaerococcus sp. NML200574]